MFCQHCGEPLTDNPALCPQCGNPQQAPATPFPAPNPFELPLRRIKTLACAWLIYAALEGFFSLVRLIITRTFPGLQFNEGFCIPLGQHLTAFLLSIIWVLVGVRFALALLAGYGLLKRAPWGRVVAIIAGVFMLIHPILGTIMGIWTLVVLLNRENAAACDARS